MAEVRLRRALTVVVTLVLAGCTSGSDILDAPVTIGIQTDSPGVSYQNPATGQRSGFDVSMYEWMSTYGEKPFHPQVVDLATRDREDALVRGGDAGGVDLVISSYSITSQRETEIDFAGPYLETRQGVMVRADDPRKITNPSELAGRSVCAESGSTSVNELREIPGLIVVESIGLLQCVDWLLDRQVDAVSTDELLLRGHVRANSGLRIEEGVAFGAIQQYGIGLPPEDRTASCELLSSNIRRFMDSGAWDIAFRTNFGDRLRSEDYRPSQLRPCLADYEPETS